MNLTTARSIRASIHILILSRKYLDEAKEEEEKVGDEEDSEEDAVEEGEEEEATTLWSTISGTSFPRARVDLSADFFTCLTICLAQSIFSENATDLSSALGLAVCSDALLSLPDPIYPLKQLFAAFGVDSCRRNTGCATAVRDSNAAMSSSLSTSRAFNASWRVMVETTVEGGREKEVMGALSDVLNSKSGRAVLFSAASAAEAVASDSFSARDKEEEEEVVKSLKRYNILS